MNESAALKEKTYDYLTDNNNKDKKINKINYWEKNNFNMDNFQKKS